MMDLRQYPAGTKIRIGTRIFCRVSTGSFWREEHDVPGNCVSRPSCSLENIEQSSGMTHVVLATAESN